MQFEVIQELGECERLWNQFTPHRFIFDEWRYRFSFYKGYSHEPYFIVGKEPVGEVGLLPLWHEKKQNYYTFFGGTFPEENTFFVNDATDISSFIQECPVETWLAYIHHSQQPHYSFKQMETCYHLDLGDYQNSIENYLASFDRKHRKNLRYDLRRLSKEGYCFRYNHLNDFERLVELNQKRFGQESDYVENEMINSMKYLMQELHADNRLNLVSLIIGEEVQAVELAAKYNDTYYVLAGGRNLEIENIGKPLIIEHLRCAQNQGIAKLNFLSSDSGWKTRWHLKTTPVLEYKNYS